MSKAYDIIIEPIISEKSMDLMQDKKYTFKVAKNANKIEIKKAIEEIFKVEVDTWKHFSFKEYWLDICNQWESSCSL